MQRRRLHMCIWDCWCYVLMLWVTSGEVADGYHAVDSCCQTIALIRFMGFRIWDVMKSHHVWCPSVAMHIKITASMTFDARRSRLYFLTAFLTTTARALQLAYQLFNRLSGWKAALELTSENRYSWRWVNLHMSYPSCLVAWAVPKLRVLPQDPWVINALYIRIPLEDQVAIREEEQASFNVVDGHKGCRSRGKIC